MPTWTATARHRPGLDLLLVRAGRAVERRRQAAAAAHGLSATGLAVLEALLDVPSASHRDLAGALGLTPATLTPVLDALDGAGLVTRERDVRDRRVVRIAVTATGRTRSALASRAVDRDVAAWLPAPPAELRGYLARIADQ
ncbi:MarR family transcriptional regulator [Pseudonocardia sp.]|uniref:MarR family transcriptional regulator n=1 Tax=Pseudonocardia sp. TaxID=60912 RepID=UPI003D1466B4